MDRGRGSLRQTMHIHESSVEIQFWKPKNARMKAQGSNGHEEDTLDFEKKCFFSTNCSAIGKEPRSSEVMNRVVRCGRRLMNISYFEVCDSYKSWSRTRYVQSYTICTLSQNVNVCNCIIEIRLIFLSVWSFRASREGPSD